MTLDKNVNNINTFFETNNENSSKTHYRVVILSLVFHLNKFILFHPFL